MGIFVNQEKIHLYSIFSLFWRENILVGPRRKHLDPTIYFPSFLPNQTHSKKVFLPIFSPKFSIHSILPPNKHTLKLGTHGFSQTVSDPWSINMNKQFNCYGSSQQIQKKKKKKKLKNSKVRLDIIKFIYIKKIKKRTKTQGNFYSFGEIKQVCK